VGSDLPLEQGNHAANRSTIQQRSPFRASPLCFGHETGAARQGLSSLRYVGSGVHNMGFVRNGFSAVAMLVAHLAACLIWSQTVAQAPATERIPMATQDRLRSWGWWPTKGSAAHEEFVGPAECAKCHSKEAGSWAKTPMAHASVRPDDSEILRGQEGWTLRLAPFSYEIKRAGQKMVYSVSDASNTSRQPLLWAFGLGRKGQTYIYQSDGSYYESRLSFYKALRGLDITTGHREETPGDVESALGRRLPAAETERCFGCHTTASTANNRFDPEGSTPGISCEACHGPGAKHVAAMKSGKIEEGRRAILNPSRLNAIVSVDFCGACHRTWGDVIQAGISGVANVRFQPYRLENSRCWGAGDARLTCIACHNPHEPLVDDTAAYDRKCLACHRTAGVKATREKSGKACRVGAKDCVSCHMPQIPMAGIHASFTDHHIRIVRPGDPYPD
jgi:Cytochrome c554 and c-prime